MLYDFSKGLRTYMLPADKSGVLKAGESATAYDRRAGALKTGSFELPEK
jgi:hypothetical protein